MSLSSARSLTRNCLRFVHCMGARTRWTRKADFSFWAYHRFGGSTAVWSSHFDMRRLGRFLPPRVVRCLNCIPAVPLWRQHSRGVVGGWLPRSCQLFAIYNPPATDRSASALGVVDLNAFHAISFKRLPVVFQSFYEKIACRHTRFVLWFPQGLLLDFNWCWRCFHHGCSLAFDHILR